MGISEIEECLQLLVGDGNFASLPVEMTADDFAENVLGFEEVEEVEQEEEYMEDEENYMESGMNYMQNEVIPEEDF